MSYPLHWLSTTFSSRTRTAELLQPEVENNVLSLHDFDLATTFLPGMHRHWPAMYSSGAAGAAFGFGYFYSRPRWASRKLTLVTGAATIAGMVYGQVRQVLAHRQFTQALENPKGFIQALSNVDRRLGGDGNLGFTLERIRAEDSGQKSEPSRIEPGFEMVREDNWDRVPSSSNSIPASGQPSQPAELKSRWEEIRAANTRNAGRQSSWDTIRQQHERSRLPGSTSQDSSVAETQDDRALEQAKFDAMLEAERRQGLSPEGRDMVR
ncbi:hypothetical protein BV22DRAFT_1027852 [Leucogyrophana mollusca]|uniref:Uncharacterized protein n=1 Tax=Leucogyrophana mollusca TaxID=85980 RepID=A0ACB8BZZ0_9AGAM|nr:hypothetical protein BV22DRAFT_1027852 [Leucogyrophana mollusca]